MRARLYPTFRRAFTIPELLIALSIFSFIVLGLASITAFGMRQDLLTRSKLGMNNQSRKGINQLLNDIRMARDIQIGSGNSTSFVEVVSGTAQEGKAIQVLLTTLRRKAANATGTTLVASFLTNRVLFQAQDYTGSNVLMVSPDALNYNYVVGVNLEFYQFLNPYTIVGTNSYYNYYRLNFKATRHAP